MTTKEQRTTREQPSMIKAYEDRIKAEVEEAKAKLNLLEAKAREQKAQVEITAIGGLKATRDNIEKKLHDLRATSDANLSRAKAAIETDVAEFKAAVEKLTAKIKPRAEAK